MSVTTTVSNLGDNRHRLRWSARFAPGQTLVFEDSDRSGRTILFSTRAARGSRIFVSRDPGQAKIHTVRVVVEQYGLVRDILHGARFRTSALRLSARRAAIRFRHGVATVSWPAVKQACA